jgi:hypothetical protein
MKKIRAIYDAQIRPLVHPCDASWPQQTAAQSMVRATNFKFLLGNQARGRYKGRAAALLGQVAAQRGPTVQGMLLYRSTSL